MIYRVIIIILVLLTVIPLLLQAEDDLVNQTASLSFSKIAATGDPVLKKHLIFHTFVYYFNSIQFKN